MGTGERWGRGKGGDGGEGGDGGKVGTGKGKERKTRRKIRVKKASFLNMAPSLRILPLLWLVRYFYLANAMCPVPKCLEVLWRCNLAQGKTVRLAAKYGTMLNTCKHNNTNETKHIHHVHCS